MEEGGLAGVLRFIPSGKWSRSRSEEALATCFSKGCTPVGCLEVRQKPTTEGSSQSSRILERMGLYIYIFPGTNSSFYIQREIGRETILSFFGMLPVFQGRVVGFRKGNMDKYSINYPMQKLPILYLWSRAWFHPSVVPSLCFSGKWSFVAQANFLKKKNMQVARSGTSKTGKFNQINTCSYCMHTP